MALGAIPGEAQQSSDPETPNPIVVTVDRSNQIGTSEFSVGVTHTRFSLDPWADPDSIQRGRDLLTAATSYQNQHIYGWGTVNPNPAPGVYEWQSLDRRVDTMRAIGGTPVITLCCAPDWMTVLGSETTTYPNLPPLSAHYDDFADLARRIAERYPDVKHFVVWNEMKGMWNRGAGQWDLVAYTEMYNKVYDALKAVDPTIQVGGPYLVIEGTDTDYGAWFTDSPITRRNDQVIDYWLEHANGADFIALDRNIIDFHDKRDYTEAERLDMVYTFTDITEEMRSRSNLPVWFIEPHMAGLTGGSLGYRPVAAATMLRAQLLGGAEAAFNWEPEQQQVGGPYFEHLFSAARQEGGAQPYPAYFVYKLFHDHFGPGTPLYASTTSLPTVDVLASDAVTLVINKRITPTTVIIDGVSRPLAGYETLLVDTAGNVVTSIIAGSADGTAATSSTGADSSTAGSLDTAVSGAFASVGADEGGRSAADALPALAVREAFARSVDDQPVANLAVNTDWLDQFSGFDADDRVIGLDANSLGVYAAGGSYGSIDGEPHAAYEDAFLRSYGAADGTVDWTRMAGSVGDEAAAAVSVHGTGSDMGIYYGGGTDSALVGVGKGQWDGFVRRHNANGSIAWTRQFGRSGNEFVTGIAAHDSGVYVVGHADDRYAGRHKGYQDAFITKFDHDGNVIWSRQFGTSDPDYATSVAVLDSPYGARIIVGGATAGALAGPNQGVWDGFVRAYDEAGVIRWTRQFGTEGDDRVLGVSGTHSSDSLGFYAVGYTEGSLTDEAFGGVMDSYIRRFSFGGNEAWTRMISSEGFDEANDVDVSLYGAHVVGWTSGQLAGVQVNGPADTFVTTFTPAGARSATQLLGSTGFDEGQDASATLTDLYIGGYADGPLPGGDYDSRVDGFAARIDVGPEAEVIDEFTRTVAQGWTQAETGGGYLLGGAASGYRVDDGRGALVFSGPDQGRQATSINASLANPNIITRIGVDERPTGSSVYGYVAARSNGADEYRAEVRIDPTGRVFLRGVRVDGGWFPMGPEVQVPGVILDDGESVWLRVRVTGGTTTRMKIRAWEPGRKEPAWQFNRTATSADLAGAGQVGLRGYVPSGVTNTPMTIWFDDFVAR
jgi:hypothetical protein